MKKSIIATGAASLALAAMPVVGAFAYSSDNLAGTVTDHLTVNIPASCTIRNANNDGTDGGSGDQSNPAIDNYYYVEMTNGEFKTNIGAADWDDRTGEPGENMTPTDTITISCNTASDPTQNPNPAGWVLTAIGAGTTGHLTDLYNDEADTSIATGVNESGSTSNWAFKVLKGTGDNVNYSAGYFTPSAEITAPVYVAVPSSELDIATGAGTFAGGFQMYYQVYVSPTQAQGTYEGAVKYTLYNPAV